MGACLSLTKVSCQEDIVVDEGYGGSDLEKKEKAGAAKSKESQTVAEHIFTAKKRKKKMCGEEFLEKLFSGF